MYIKYCILFTLQTQVHCHPMSAFSCKIWEVHGYHVSLNLSLQNRGKGKGLALPLLKRSKVKMSFLNFMTDIAFVDVTRLRKSQHLWWAFRVNIQRVCYNRRTRVLKVCSKASSALQRTTQRATQIKPNSTELR